jgi:hypothetical protein
MAAYRIILFLVETGDMGQRPCEDIIDALICRPLVCFKPSVRSAGDEYQSKTPW